VSKGKGRKRREILRIQLYRDSRRKQRKKKRRKARIS